jgi:hypothetical protein
MRGTQREGAREEIMPGAEDYRAGGAPSVIQLPASRRRNPYISVAECHPTVRNVAYVQRGRVPTSTEAAR